MSSTPLPDPSPNVHSLWVEVGQRSLLRLRGPDALRYLNGQVSQDLRGLEPGHLVMACFLDRHGRIEAHVGIHRQLDDFFIDVASEHAERLVARVEKYIIADDVEAALLQSRSRILYEWRLGPTLPMADPSSAATMLRSTRFQHGGREAWLPTDADLPQGAVLLGQQAKDWLILNGVPDAVAEFDHELFPQECGLVDQTVDFHKGCYLGQEVVSRIKTKGKVPRRLVWWQAAQCPEAEGELALWQDGARLGSVTRYLSRSDCGSTGFALISASVANFDSVLIGAERGLRIPALLTLAHLPKP